MVLAQPYLPNTYLTGTEPYRFTDQAKPRQFLAIARTLEVALQAPHGLRKTHFTVFPEYSIPGADGIAEIERVLGSDRWPTGSVVIGGTDALTRDEYLHLLEQDSTHVDATCNGAGAVSKNHWVNCAVTWIKSTDSLERWIQPKLHPAWDERNVRLEQMFCGGSVFLFSGRLETDNTPFQFATLICYDWIASIGGQVPVQALLADIHSRADGYQQPLSWVFVIQRNRRPSDESFLTGIIDFFDQTKSPNAIRTNACLIFANLVIHFTLVMNQAILGLALLAAKTESVERRFSKTSGGGSLNGLPASKLAASICSVSAGQRGSFVRTARPRRVGRPDEARCSVAGADARPLPRREPSCTTRGCRCGVGFWPCGWPALRKQG